MGWVDVGVGIGHLLVSEASGTRSSIGQAPATTCPPASPQFEHLIVNAAMLEDARQREKDLEASLAAKQGQLSASRHEAEARQYTAELATLQAQILALRQVGLKYTGQLLLLRILLLTAAQGSTACRHAACRHVPHIAADSMDFPCAPPCRVCLCRSGMLWLPPQRAPAGCASRAKS